MRMVVLQHVACEPPAALSQVLTRPNVDVVTVRLDEGDAIPDWREADAVISMGGPMSANDDTELAWLADEKRFIAEVTDAGRAYLGICLGAQLLAASHDARVFAGARPEVGVCTVELTSEAMVDPVFAGLPRYLQVLQWHGDTFDLPEGAVRLAKSPDYHNQAFRWHTNAYAIQFHLEVTPELCGEWAQIPEYAAYLLETLGEGGEQKLLREMELHADEMNRHARALGSKWLDLAISLASDRVRAT